MLDREDTAKLNRFLKNINCMFSSGWRLKPGEPPFADIQFLELCVSQATLKEVHETSGELLKALDESCCARTRVWCNLDGDGETGG